MKNLLLLTIIISLFSCTPEIKLKDDFPLHHEITYKTANVDSMIMSKDTIYIPKFISKSKEGLNVYFNGSITVKFTYDLYNNPIATHNPKWIYNNLRTDIYYSYCRTTQEYFKKDFLKDTLHHKFLNRFSNLAMKQIIISTPRDISITIDSLEFN